MGAGQGVVMFWKYIEKISWFKVIHHFLGMKHKCLDMQISYFGERAFDLDCGWTRRMNHAGPRFYVTILGVLIGGTICDYRHWNNAENRFYFDEEPELSWIGYKGYTEQDFWRDIEKTAEVHHLDENYLARCQAAFMEYKQEKEEQALRSKQEEFEEEKPFVLKHPIDWEQVKYGRDGKDWQKCPIKKIGEDEIEVRCFRNKHIFSVKCVVLWLDLYDKKNRLISKAADYDDYPSYLEEKCATHNLF